MYLYSLFWDYSIFSSRTWWYFFSSHLYRFVLSVLLVLTFYSYFTFHHFSQNVFFSWLHLFLHFHGNCFSLYIVSVWWCGKRKSFALCFQHYDSVVIWLALRRLFLYYRKYLIYWLYFHYWMNSSLFVGFYLKIVGNLRI